MGVPAVTYKQPRAVYEDKMVGDANEPKTPGLLHASCNAENTSYVPDVSRRSRTPESSRSWQEMRRSAVLCWQRINDCGGSWGELWRRLS